MSHFLLQSRASLGGEDYVGHVHDLKMNRSINEIEDTVFGDTFKNRILGLQDFEASVGLRNDLADNSVDEDVDALFAAEFAFIGGYLQSFTESATNPEYQATMMLKSAELGGGVGEGSGITLSMAISSGTLVRDVT